MERLKGRIIEIHCFLEQPGAITAEYEDFYDLVIDVLAGGLYPPCFTTEFTLLTPYIFLENDPVAMTLILEKELVLEAGVFEDSKLVMTLMTYESKQVEIPIVVSVANCKITNLSFVEPVLHVVHLIGGGAQVVNLPAIV